MADPVIVRAEMSPAATRIEETSPRPASRLAVALLYALNIFLSAFLLFQVELMMAKFVLPRYGGGPSVWSTALLVFQLLLLGGYWYAAFLSKKLSPNQQAKTHCGLIAACAVVMMTQALAWHVPLFPRLSWLSGSDYPVPEITALLLVGAGLQCILLSANSPLCQSWFASGSPTSPYRLYAVSNLGSLLGLISYPFVVERKFVLTSQAWIWTGLFALVLISSAACSFLRIGEPVSSKLQPVPKRTKKISKAAHESRLWWLLLAGCSCTMLLAVTNVICQQVAPVPLLWVLPLSLYLLSFIICFDNPRWYRREIFVPLYLVLAYMALILLPRYNEMRIVQVVLILCSVLFVVCMICHGELARSKPPSEKLTSFYLTIATGGALGSAFVALFAPLIFDRFWEFHVGLLGCGALLAAALFRDRRSWPLAKRFAALIVISASVVLSLGALYMIEKGLEREIQTDSVVVQRARNFFGVKAIVQKPSVIGLFHGRTLHGSQSLLPAFRTEPLLYYSRPSGIGTLLSQFPRTADHPNLRVGVIGMGVGSLSAYAQDGDYYRFYEIDPTVIQFSSGNHPYFTFIESSPAKTEVVQGDARIRLEEELFRGQSHDFDVLVVDAFSGDSIPVHLLTREAMELYLQRIRGPGSVIAFHLSNSALDLRPLMASLGRAYHLSVIEVHEPLEVDPLWVLLSRDPGALGLPGLITHGRTLQVAREIAPWTDEYSSPYELLVR